MLQMTRPWVTLTLFVCVSETVPNVIGRRAGLTLINYRSSGVSHDVQ